MLTKEQIKDLIHLAEEDVLKLSEKNSFLSRDTYTPVVLYITDVNGKEEYQLSMSLCDINEDKNPPKTLKYAGIEALALEDSIEKAYKSLRDKLKQMKLKVFA